MVKKIGIIGGLSPESTVSYYLHITRTYAKRFGGCSAPELFIGSVNLEQYFQWSKAGQWDAIARHMAQTADSLLAAGADFGLIATNTMHKVFHKTQGLTELPLLNLLTPLAATIKKNSFTTVGVLGTSTTMSDPFYAKALAQEGIRSLAPTKEQQQEVHRIIMEELVLGKLLENSRAYFLDVMQDLTTQGAQGMILGCTEIPLLITPKDTDLPLFDTAIIHADAALEHALA